MVRMSFSRSRVPHAPRQFGNVAITAVLALLLCLTIAACSSGPEPSTTAASATDDAFSALVDSQIAQAELAGATDAQVAILREARGAGVMTHEMAMSAARDFVQCLDDVGIKAVLEPSEGAEDLPAIQYRLYTQDTAVADQCLVITYNFVDSVYQLQPAAQAHGKQVLADHEDAFVACLLENGIDVPPDTTQRELAGAVLSAINGIEPFGDGMLAAGPVDCLTPLGLSIDDL